MIFYKLNYIFYVFELNETLTATKIDTVKLWQKIKNSHLISQVSKNKLSFKKEKKKEFENDSKNPIT